MPSFSVSPDDIRDMSVKRLGPAGEELHAAAGSLQSPANISAGEVWQEAPGVISRATAEITTTVEGLTADLATFQGRTNQAADTYQAMEEANVTAAGQAASES